MASRQPQNESSLTSCRTVVTTDDLTQNQILYFNISERETKTHVAKLSALVFNITTHASSLHAIRTKPWHYLHLLPPLIPLYSNPHLLNIFPRRRNPLNPTSILTNAAPGSVASTASVSVWGRWIWRGGNGRRLLSAVVLRSGIKG